MSVLHIVSVHFLGSSKQYAYKSNLDLSVGEYVVVEANSSYSVAVVVDPFVTDETIQARATKWIVTSFNDAITHLDTIKEQEHVKMLLMKKMELRKRVLESHKVYKDLAETDEVMKGLYTEYKELL